MKKLFLCLTAIYIMFGSILVAKAQESFIYVGYIQDRNRKDIDSGLYPRVIAKEVGTDTVIAESPARPTFKIRIQSGRQIYLVYTCSRCIPRYSENYVVNDDRDITPLPVSLTILNRNTGTKSQRQAAIKAIIRLGKIAGMIEDAIYKLRILKSQTNDSELLNEINSAENEIRQAQEKAITPEQESLWTTYDEIINLYDNAKTIPLPQQQRFLEIIKDDSIPAEIRNETIRAFANSSPSTTVLEEALIYFREQSDNINSKIFSSSIFSLAKIGTNVDKKNIISWADTTNYEKAISSIKAIGEANLTDGLAVIEKLARDETLDISMSSLSVDVLQEFASKRDNLISKIALISIYENENLPLQLRVQAFQSITTNLIDFNSTQIARITNAMKVATSDKLKSSFLNLKNRQK